MTALDHYSELGDGLNFPSDPAERVRAVLESRCAARGLIFGEMHTVWITHSNGTRMSAAASTQAEALQQLADKLAREEWS